jgi:hypothetical protein
MNFFILGLASLTQKAAKHSQSKTFSEQRERARPDLSPALQSSLDFLSGV